MEGSQLPRVKKHVNEAPCHTQWYYLPSNTHIQSFCLYSVCLVWVVENFLRFSHVLACGHTIHEILLHFAIYISTLSPTWTTSSSLITWPKKNYKSTNKQTNASGWFRYGIGSDEFKKQIHIQNYLTLEGTRGLIRDDPKLMFSFLVRLSG